MNLSAPFFSIIIPTYNESADILKTLNSIRENDFPDYEVLVVDASRDDTPSMVRNFGDERFRLLPQDNQDGRCGARNQGIRKANGEVVVILNADVRLPTDFLSRLKKHYDEAADYVIVDSTVENRHHPFGAMVEAEHHYWYHSGRETVNWCEGYSCRRSCALAAGLFPEKKVVPICAGEDAVFGDEMAKRFKRVTDLNLSVSHGVPEDFATFWNQRIGRGQGCTQRRLLIDHWSWSRVFWDSVWWSVKSIGWIGFFLPMFQYARRLHQHGAALPTYLYLYPLFLSRLAHEIGRWRGFFRLLRLHSKKVAVE